MTESDRDPTFDPTDDVPTPFNAGNDDTAGHGAGSPLFDEINRPPPKMDDADVVDDIIGHAAGENQYIKQHGDDKPTRGEQPDS